MEIALKTSKDAPFELCGYSVAGVLAQQKTYLAIGPAGRGLVLKRLDDECLLRGLLHPSIRERLSRVRELPHGGVANLHGVGRDGEHAYLIWEFADGVPFDEFAASSATSPRDIAVAARNLALATTSLHLQGIVHGALVTGNILVGPGGRIRLTHVSPLLFSNPAVDAHSVLALLDYVIQVRGEGDTPLGQIVLTAMNENMNLRDLGGHLAAFIESRELDGPVDRSEPAVSAPRKHALIGAAVVAFLGLAMAGSIWFVVQSGHFELPQSLHMQP
jgi:serine/threonine protein kinase